MKNLIDGVQQFRNQVFAGQRELFERLGSGQKPQALFITCSDSRINPNLLTQTHPGDLFILRNAGNIVPPHGSGEGEAATIEFAVAGLGVQDIVVCGHSHCGAMHALLEPARVAALPAVSHWLRHAEATKRIVQEVYRDRAVEDLLSVTIQENVLAQISNLRTHPVVAARVAAGKLRLHAWVYKLTTGEVFSYDPRSGQFGPLAAIPHEPAAVGALEGP